MTAEPDAPVARSATSAAGPGLRVRRIGLVVGPTAAALLYLVLPHEYRGHDGQVTPFTDAGRATIGLMAWMAAWWMTEAVEIEATALLPIVVFPMFGVLPLGKTTANYGADVIFLFLGGFVLALSMARWGLDRRVALATLRVVGTRPRAIVAGTMGATALLSMWVSNTATAAMMVPIVLSLVDATRRRRPTPDRAGGAAPGEDRDLANFERSALLGVAYAASIGGLGTIVGSPPNGILVRYLEQSMGVRISFLAWMSIGLPVVLTFLPVAWFLTTFVLFPCGLRDVAGGREHLREEWSRLGPLNRGERVTLAVFAVTALLWITSPLLARWRIAGTRPLAGLSDAGIAIAAALALFLIPVDREKRRHAMDWETAAHLPWGVLLLFGGGLALASATEANGVASFLGSAAAGLAGWPVWGVVLAVLTIMVFLSELTSNTAQVATMLPILAALAPALGVPAGTLLVPATVGASCAFMMPVGTPPNAIVFGTRRVPMRQMMRAGFWLNLAGILLVFGLTFLVFVPVLRTIH